MELKIYPCLTFSTKSFQSFVPMLTPIKLQSTHDEMESDMGGGTGGICPYCAYLLLLLLLLMFRFRLTSCEAPVCVCVGGGGGGGGLLLLATMITLYHARL